MSVNKTYVVVSKPHYLADPYHAPYSTISASSRGKAKSIYFNSNKDLDIRYIDVICRLS